MAAQENIPNNIAEDILVRLPIKSSIRFKFVTNKWDHIFSDSNFFKTQKAKAPSSMNNHMNFCVGGIDVDSVCALHIGFDTSEGTLRAPVPITSPFGPNDRIHIGPAHCDGILCVLTQDGTVVVWNPTTHEYKRFDLPRALDYRTYIGLGLGYVSSTDEHKEVALISGESSNFNVLSKLYVLSLKTGMWKLNPNKKPHWIWRFANQVVIAFDGCLYWNCNVVIICFDLEQDHVMKDNEIQVRFIGDFGRVSLFGEFFSYK